MKQIKLIFFIILNVLNVLNVLSSNNVIDYQNNNLVDLVIFSYNRPMQLYALLESMCEHITGLDQITVIYRTDLLYQASYLQLQDEFKQVSFVKQNNPPHDFKPLVMDHVFKLNHAQYVIFAVDDIVIKDHVNLVACVDLLEQHHAYSFLLRLGANINFCYMINLPSPAPAGLLVAPNIYKYNFNSGCVGDWYYPNNLDMSLYRKTDIYEKFNNLNWHNPNLLEGNWAAQANFNQTGLYFANSKIVNLPLNLVNINTWANKCMNSYTSQQLQEHFELGKKIDIRPFKNLNHNSVHIDYDISFVTR